MTPVELRFTVGLEFLAELEQVKTLLSHKLPGAGLAALFHECMRLALARRKRGGGSGERYVPAAVRRQVWERDQGRCTFVGESGRCGSAHQVELHHIVRYADGGPATVDNLTVHCRGHNQWIELSAGTAGPAWQ